MKVIGASEAEIERFERQRDIAVQRRDIIIGELTLCKVEIEKFKEAQKKLEDDYTKEIKKIGKNKELRKILLFCEETLKATEKIKDEIMEETRAQVERELALNF